MSESVEQNVEKDVGPFKWASIALVIILVNLGLYFYLLLFCTFILAQYVNGFLIPEGCIPSSTYSCEVAIAVVLWGGVFAEIGLFSGIIYLINKFLLSWIGHPKAKSTAKWIFIASITIGGVIFLFIGFSTFPRPIVD